jgi:TRAP-type C4-dicarboxylate transport system permease small subunit
MMFLGIIAVGIILFAGFKWMTAGGSEEKTSEATKLMTSGVIGLIIILSAWGIAYFILENAVNVTQ